MEVYSIPCCRTFLCDTFAAILAVRSRSLALALYQTPAHSVRCDPWSQRPQMDNNPFRRKQPNWFRYLAEEAAKASSASTQKQTTLVRPNRVNYSVPVTPTFYPFAGAFIEAAAVYVITDATYRVIYIGETKNLGQRINQHRADRFHLMHRYNPEWIKMEFGYENEQLRKDRERQLILQYNPPCNRCL